RDREHRLDALSPRVGSRQFYKCLTRVLVLGDCRLAIDPAHRLLAQLYDLLAVIPPPTPLVPDQPTSRRTIAEVLAMLGEKFVSDQDIPLRYARRLLRTSCPF